MSNSIRYDDREIKITTAQKRAFSVLAAFQALLIIATYLLVILQAAGMFNYAKAAMFGVVLYAVMYFNFLKAYGAFADMGVAPLWAKLTRVISPALYLPGAVIAMLI